MSGVAERIGQLQNPEYTGANRCTPCTIVNSVIALVFAAVVGAAVVSMAGTTAGGAAAGVVLLVSAASIYFRGFLVPGTPTLTKRYFPDRVLAYFEKAPPDYENDPSVPWGHTYNKHPDPEAQQAAAEAGGMSYADVDVEERLLASGILTECENADDLCLVEEFADEWEREARAVREADASRDQLLSLLDVEDADVEYDEYDTAFRATADGTFVGRWESEAAFLADVSAGELLAEHVDDWDELEVDDRGAILNGLRLFIETCPSCDGPVSMDTHLVESCCRSHKVAALSCEDCEARLFESSALD